MNKAIKKAIVNVLLTATAGSLIIFVLLGLLFESGGPATTAEPAATEIEKIENIKAAEADQRFYFTNMPEMESPFELILFDAEIKAAGKRLKSLLPPDSSEDRIRKTKMIYDYMKEMAPAREKGVLLELAAAAVKYAEKYSVPLGLVVGVMQTESNFNTKALSNMGACGPMQVMWNIHSGLLRANGINSRDALFTADLGTAAGCLILSRYLRDEKSVAGGLKRYYGELSGNYISSTYSNWHTFELYASGILETESKKALAKDKNYLASLMTARKPAASAKTKTEAKPMTMKAEGEIRIKKQDGSTIVWRAK